MDEQTAIARMKGGDISGLEVLVKQYQTQAIRSADFITRDLEHAKDIVQAAFIRVFHRIEQFDTSRSFGPWFMRIVINDAIKAVERNREISLETPVNRAISNGATLADVLPDESPGPDDLIEHAELQASVWEALGQLSPQERAVIVMRHFLAFSETEMAEALQSPKGTIKWRLHEARKNLQHLLTTSHPPPEQPVSERSGEINQ